MENAPEQILLPLEHELAVERLRRYLERHPEEATKLAIAYFEDFTMLAIEYKHLERQQLYASQFTSPQHNS